MIEIADAAYDAPDKRIAWLVQWIEKEMCPGLSAGRSSGLSFERAAWHGRRLLIFTEWEDTRRWLEGRLCQAIAHTDGEAGGRIAKLRGLTRQPERAPQAGIHSWSMAR